MIEPVRGAGRGIVSLARFFSYQSYFSNTLLHLAVRDQGVGSSFARDDIQEENIAGYGVGLLPSSETPLAVEFKRADAAGGTATLVLKPGQVVYPFGRSPSARFEGVRWGLPYGWLGGGLATLVVITSPEAVLDWPKDDHEVIFHRQRVAIQANDFDYEAITDWPQNWPTRFPSLTTRRSGTAVTLTQSGQPVLHVQPTRTQLSLRLSGLAAPASMRCLLFGTEAFALSNATPPSIETQARIQDVTWGTQSAAYGVNIPGQYPVVEYQSGMLVSLGCERALAVSGLYLIQGPAQEDGALSGMHVDVVRYGRL